MTEQQRKVLILVARGYSYNEIGEELFITRSTVSSHIYNTLSHLNADNSHHAIAIAIQHGTISPSDIPPKPLRKPEKIAL
jgi:NarL family two-component system response regulator LiaR